MSHLSSWKGPFQLLKCSKLLGGSSTPSLLDPYFSFSSVDISSIMFADVEDISVNFYCILSYVILNSGQYLWFSWRFWKQWKVPEFCLHLLTLDVLVMSFIIVIYFVHHLSAVKPFITSVCIESWPCFCPLFCLCSLCLFISRTTKMLCTVDNINMLRVAFWIYVIEG